MAISSRNYESYPKSIPQGIKPFALDNPRKIVISNAEKGEFGQYYNSSISPTGIVYNSDPVVKVRNSKIYAEYLNTPGGIVKATIKGIPRIISETAKGFKEGFSHGLGSILSIGE